jgi:hypothetical protein
MLRSANLEYGAGGGVQETVNFGHAKGLKKVVADANQKACSFFMDISMNPQARCGSPRIWPLSRLPSQCCGC